MTTTTTTKKILTINRVLSVVVLSILLLLLLLQPTQSLSSSSKSSSRTTLSMMASSAKKHIFITGANTGIGLALTKQLVKDHNCHVYLGARNEERGTKAVEEVRREAGESVEFIQIDVSDTHSIESAASTLSQKLLNNNNNQQQQQQQQLYAIINNAGTGFSHNSPPRVILDTNARGPHRVIQSFLPFLHPARGRIINLGSGAGPMFFRYLKTDEEKKRYVSPISTEEDLEAEIRRIEDLVGEEDEFGAYAGSKALLACYTMGLAREYPNLMISVITPGWIKTNMTKGSGASKEPHEGTVSLRKCLFDDLSGKSGYFWGSDGLRSPLHCGRNPGEEEYDGELPEWAK